ncbi:MAG TPA: flagellar basal body rod protein FlgB [Nitrospinota bacterium]|jgi:flagellar basal-body rod protein FlgB|nr:flagellar basal body rod protein FlgB [Nitrospinota bacterium]
MEILDRMLFSDKTPKLLKKSLDLHLQKNSVISSNIANVDTPGYKAVDLKFDEQLQSAIGTGNQIKMKATQKKHFTADIKQIDKVKPTVSEENDPARPDGNNVKIEKEMSKLVETQLMYNSIVQAMTKRGGILRYAIEEGKR